MCLEQLQLGITLQGHPSFPLSSLSFAEGVQLELSLEGQCPGQPLPAHNCLGSPEGEEVFQILGWFGEKMACARTSWFYTLQRLALSCFITPG